MILYLAGLKAFDPSLREAAQIDGANERQLFFRVVFPVLKPINIVVLVITIIESLRAFDLVYIINRGINGLELLSVLVTNTMLGESSRVGLRVGHRGRAAADLRRADHHLPQPRDARGERMTTARTAATAIAPAGRGHAGDALRPAARGAPRLPHHHQRHLAVPARCGRSTHRSGPMATRRSTGTSRCRRTLSLDNYVNAWNHAELARYFLNTLDHRRPGGASSVLFLASMMAFA